MDNNKIYSYVDHTALKPTTTWDEILTLCNQAIEYKTASVCVPPYYIKDIKAKYPNLNICTVIGFPLGYNTTEVKVDETQNAISHGANEIDMVINIAALKNKDYDFVENEIAEIKKACGDKILKVIIETAYLTEEEKIKMCEIITKTGADYIKTSTGFAPTGATMADIILFKKHIGPNVKIKAAGGIRTKQDMIDFIEAGCSRLGTSSAVSILG